MWWHRKDLDNSTSVPYYGFFYKGLKQKFFYWEIVESISKLLFVFANKFIYNELNVQILLASIILSVKAGFIHQY